jgi:hypothetical protein
MNLEVLYNTTKAAARQLQTYRRSFKLLGDREVCRTQPPSVADTNAMALIPYCTLAAMHVSCKAP